MLVSVTDHAVERYRQRVRGTLDARAEIAARVGRAWAAGDVCLEDKPRGELVVVTLWQEGEDAAVPRRFTDALKREDRRRT